MAFPCIYDIYVHFWLNIWREMSAWRPRLFWRRLIVWRQERCTRCWIQLQFIIAIAVIITYSGVADRKAVSLYFHCCPCQKRLFSSNMICTHSPAYHQKWSPASSIQAFLKTANILCIAWKAVFAQICVEYCVCSSQSHENNTQFFNHQTETF